MRRPSLASHYFPTFTGLQGIPATVRFTHDPSFLVTALRPKAGLTSLLGSWFKRCAASARPKAYFRSLAGNPFWMGARKKAESCEGYSAHIETPKPTKATGETTQIILALKDIVSNPYCFGRLVNLSYSVA